MSAEAFDIKIKMLQYRITQRRMCEILNERGLRVHEAEISYAITGRRAGKKSDAILSACKEVLDAYEHSVPT